MYRIPAQEVSSLLEIPFPTRPGYDGSEPKAFAATHSFDEQASEETHYSAKAVKHDILRLPSHGLIALGKTSQLTIYKGRQVTCIRRFLVPDQEFTDIDSSRT
jgi:hypothetical protein